MEQLKNELLKNKKMVINFKNGYECLEFSNFLNLNKIYHTKKTIKCRPICVVNFTIVEY